MTSLKEQALLAFKQAYQPNSSIEDITKHFKASDIRNKVTECNAFNIQCDRDLSARGNSKAFWEAVIKWCPVTPKTSEQIENERLGAIWEIEIDALEEEVEDQTDSDLAELNEIQDCLNDIEKAIVLDASNLPSASLPSDVTGKAKRASIQIAGIKLEVFQMPNGKCIMSQIQVAKAVDKGESLFRGFLTTKQSEALSGDGFSFAKITTQSDNPCQRGGVRDIKGIHIDIVSEFWMLQAFKGNTKAQALVSACMQEALQRRCDNVFGIAKTEQQYEHQSSIALSQWQEARVKLRETHNGFTNACVRYGFSAALAHDKLTEAICGKSAKELREMELINGQWDIGLNHLDDLQDIKRVGRMKYHFSRYRKGTVDDRVSKARKDVLKEKDTL